jgi:hydroxylamine dehydrogenase
MAPDYSWWHGFYEMKKRCMVIDEMIHELEESGKPATVHTLRGSGGDTTKPDFSK